MNSALRGLYPELDPWDQGMLPVSSRHSLYYEQSGNPAGKPVVFLHGGPGGGAGPQARRFFDPQAYRIILFDQRGCGRSTPHAELAENTTPDLVADIERLRLHLGIERWQVFGGSWGSTLALAYAEAHPAQVSELVLRGIFLLRRMELEWFYQRGCDMIWPDAWEEYVAAIPPGERGDLMAAYHRRLTSDDPEVRLAAARAWTGWEVGRSFLVPNTDYIAGAQNEQFATAFARIECHYFVHGGFFEQDGQLLRDAHRLHGIPGVIVHGRYDVVCPLRSAWDLHRAWPEADLRIVPAVGHSAFEPAITHELVSATDRFRP